MDPNLPNQQQSQPEAPTEGKMLILNKQILLIIAGALILLLIIVSSISYSLGARNQAKKQQAQITTTTTSTKIATTSANQNQPISIDTANWKIYSGNTLGITFLYPQEYNTQEVDKRVSVNNDVGTVFDVQKILTSDTVDDWWQKEGDFIESNKIGSAINTDDYTKSTAVLNGYNAYFFKLSINSYNKYKFPAEFYAIKKNNAVYLISYLIDNDSKETIDNILYSFKFTTQYDSNLIKDAFVVYGNGFEDESSFAINIEKNNNKYATGKGEGKNGSFSWGAVKINEEWAIVFQGQKAPICSDIDNDNFVFPVNFVTQCYNDKEELISRN